jgi:hypothetical protein
VAKTTVKTAASPNTLDGEADAKSPIKLPILLNS